MINSDAPLRPDESAPIDPASVGQGVGASPAPAERPFPSREANANAPTEITATIDQLITDRLRPLEDRKRQLKTEIAQLEQRQIRLQAEMRTNFAGTSEDIAVRVQSFKEYLLGSLQDLVVAADRLELVRQVEIPAATHHPEPATPKPTSNTFDINDRTFAEPNYQGKNDRIRQVIEVFKSDPDYYGPAWKLRRTFDRIPAERTADWFFTQGGRGAVKTLGSRLQNILVGSAVISILYNLYGDQLRPLILANSPERLGEWRRGLQDCLGLTRNDFGNDRGPALFEFAEPLVQRAERAQKDGKLPLIIIDEMEEAVNLGVLQFPLWLAFAPAIPNYQASNFYQAY
jgi:Protein of unknown function (DUF3086)